MSKRRLSKQQRARIAESQRKELLGNSRNSSFGEAAAEQNCNGRVISHFGQRLDVESLDPEQQGKVVRCHQRANLPNLVTGDLVVWDEDEAESGVIVAVAERRSLFGRPTAGNDLKPIAANIDLVIVVIAPFPEAFLNLIDRYLVAIECLGLESLLVLNKVDLLDDNNSQHFDNMLSMYEDIGYSTYRVSALEGKGIRQLEDRLKARTTVLVGQSGVGKSSLINSLGLDSIAVVGQLSQARSKGVHTTTTAKLFHLAGFDLVDSPGIREFGLGHINPQQLLDGFIEFRALSGQCKFRDCAHQAEPGCAIQQAVADGDIYQQRLDNYFQILRSIEVS